MTTHPDGTDQPLTAAEVDGDPHDRPAEPRADAARRLDVVNGLRDLADWLARHPDVPVPTSVELTAHLYHGEVPWSEQKRMMLHLADTYGAKKHGDNDQHRWVTMKLLPPDRTAGFTLVVHGGDKDRPGSDW